MNNSSTNRWTFQHHRVNFSSSTFVCLFTDDFSPRRPHRVTSQIHIWHVTYKKAFPPQSFRNWPTACIDGLEILHIVTFPVVYLQQLVWFWRYCGARGRRKATALGGIDRHTTTLFNGVYQTVSKSLIHWTPPPPTFQPTLKPISLKSITRRTTRQACIIVEKEIYRKHPLIDTAYICLSFSFTGKNQKQNR